MIQPLITKHLEVMHACVKSDRRVYLTAQTEHSLVCGKGKTRLKNKRLDTLRRVFSHLAIELKDFPVSSDEFTTETYACACVRAWRARVRVDIQPWRDSSAGPHVSCEHAPDR